MQKSLKCTEGLTVQKLSRKCQQRVSCCHCGCTNLKMIPVISVRQRAIYVGGKGRYLQYAGHLKGTHLSRKKLGRKGSHVTKQVSTEQSIAPGKISMFAIGRRSSSPIVVEILLNGSLLCMEVDKGAAVSIMLENTKNRLFPTLQLCELNVLLLYLLTQKNEWKCQEGLPFQYMMAHKLSHWS